MVETTPEAISLLRSALPWWGAQGLWGPALVATVACTLIGSWAAIGIAAAPLRRLAAEAPWYERARHLQPAQAAALSGLLLPAVAFGVLVSLERGPLLTLPAGWALGAIVAVALLASAWPRRRLLRLRGRDEASALGVMRDDAIGTLLMAPQLGIAIVLAMLLRAPFTAVDALLLAGGVAATALTAVHAGLPLLRLLGAARSAPERVQAIVAPVAARLGARLERVEVVDWSLANAFALPLCGRLVFTVRCCQVLDDAQLAAIAAHELGHLSESGPTRAARFASGFLLLPLGTAPLLMGYFGWWGLALPMSLLVLAAVALRALTRRLEVRADHVAHGDELEPGLYARALEALYRDNGAPMVGPQQRAPHPHLYDRMVAAGAPPDHPRPAAPSRGRRLAGAAVTAGLTLPTALFLLMAPLSARFETDPAARVLALRHAVVLHSGRDDVLAFAMALADQGQVEPALAVARAAAALDPIDFAGPAFQATLHSRRHECREAEQALAVAQTRARALEAATDDPWLLSAERWLESCRATTATARLL